MVDGVTNFRSLPTGGLTFGQSYRTPDLGAGPFGNPYRWRPLSWEVEGETYCNERAIGTQQTGFSFVSQSRDWLPDPIGGILWFGVDDAATTVPPGHIQKL